MGVDIDVTKPLATVRVGPPQRNEVLDPADWSALADAFSGLCEQDDVGCVVVRGVRGRAPSTRPTPDAREEPRAHTDEIAAALRQIRVCRHPTVAIIEGLCVGAGLEIAACCDLRVCGETSRFGAPLDRLGLAESYDELDPLEQLLGGSPALDLMLDGTLIDAEHARVVGLVNRVYSDRAVVEHGYGLAARIAAGAPLVNRWHKSFLRRLLVRAAD